MGRLHFVQAVQNDPRELPAVRRLMKQTVRLNPTLGGAYHVLANLFWEDRRFGEAL